MLPFITLDTKTAKLLLKPFLRSIQDWRQSILLSFGYDPLSCSKCGTSMLVLEVYHKKLHYLNNIERARNMNKSMLIIILSL